MNIWWKTTISIVAVILLFRASKPIKVFAKPMSDVIGFSVSKFSKPQNFQSWLSAKNNSYCQQVETNYTEVYAFETQNYYIGICQLEDNFFYYRLSKNGEEDELVIPAQAVFGNGIFQATKNKVTYFVGMDANGYYSSVMKNENEIIFEPELRSSATVLSSNREPVKAVATDRDRDNTELDSSPRNRVRPQLSSSNYHNSSDNSQICTRDKTDFHPRLQGWQGFIGESPEMVSEYATSNGHDFIYTNADTNAEPSQALIKTVDGSIINLDLATFGKTVARVCVGQIAEAQ